MISPLQNLDEDIVSGSGDWCHCVVNTKQHSDILRRLHASFSKFYPAIQENFLLQIVHIRFKSGRTLMTFFARPGPIAFVVCEVQTVTLSGVPSRSVTNIQP